MSGNTSVVIEEIPHKEQRYPTVGDWTPPTKAKRPVKIRVSKMKDWRYTFLVAFHELIEYQLCKQRGITDDEVVDFDVQFEAERAAGLHSKDAEPGDDPRAPYKKEHQFATKKEREMAKELGVSWSAYEKAVLALDMRKKRRKFKKGKGKNK
nr:hypothetical protein [Ferrimicrobium acidiphilum]